MTMWLPKLEQFPGPRYQALAAAIEAAIRTGELPVGAKLPPQRDLAWKLGVTVGTISRGYMLAEQKGLLSGEVGRGTFVKPIHPPGLHEAANGNDGGVYQGEIVSLATPGVIELSHNEPSLPEYDEILRRSLQRLAGSRGLQHLLGYSRTLGDPAHRAAAAKWIGRTGLSISADQVIVTAGAQQALAVAIAAMTMPNEPMMVESLTYGGVHENARLRPARLEAVAMDEEGIIPEALAETARRTGSRLVLVQPTIHNPTTATMSARRREDVVAVARKHDLTIIEDDVYGFVVRERPLPLAALAPERTIYIASASKCMAPGLRVGWMAAPPALIERFADALHAYSVNNPRLNQEIVRQWIEDGTAEMLVERLREEAGIRNAMAAEILEGLNMRSHPASLHCYLELPEPWQPNDFTNQALGQGVRIASCTSFVPDNRANPPPWVRISLAPSPDREQLAEGLRRLRSLLERGPSARRAVV
ncbi:PLP-dependent aminotransferase family protein [uncultured Ferrovibrio sp.]|jgi:Transcriptional regulators containing a DNA-binding HTH domain and an aminotransferase domain (MocR family) and their eukaryotic orthologs|uniref:aminotransferase-like domain-containing protein n=1 Tax=uncultured Ferrovibrio sp. TaxID=1576913 RepID=UPI0026074ADD|nr:PLP-dependent aminotransferase family protein [uncultured Ferrovibrio sp.]